MVYRGKVQNGHIVLESGARLPEGTDVQIEPIETPPAPGGVQAFLASDAHWHGTDEELYRLLAELKHDKQEELRRQLSEPEQEL
jgi:hypothetical protein